MTALLQDLRYGARMLVKRPGFTAIIVITLALGIGVNTAVFSLVNAVLWRPLPFRDSKRLVMLWSTNPQHADRYPASIPNFLDWRQRNEVCDDMAAFTTATFNLAGESEPEVVVGGVVSAGFFETLGVTPALGRWFLSEENQPGAPKVVVLSHSLWQQRLGSDRGVIGRELRINAEPFKIVGVMPPNFDYPNKVRLWVPLDIDPKSNPIAGNRRSFFLNVLARMKEGVTLEQAQQNLDSISRQLGEQYPLTNREAFVGLGPMQLEVTGAAREPLLLLFGAVGLILLIACANVANLLLARTSGRENEMAIRAALGANRSRLLRQVLTESVLLAMLGGGLGLLIAVWGLDWMTNLSTLKIARLSEVTLDGRVFGFTALIALLTGLIFGSIPALVISLQPLVATLKGSAGSVTAGPGRQRLRSGLVVIEVALSLILLVGAGLLLKSFINLRAVNPGFNPQGVLAMNLTLPATRYGHNDQRAVFLQQLTERLEAVPGVQSTATTAFGLLGENYWSRIFIIEGRPEPGPGQALFAGQVPVSPDYFRTLEIPLLRGRSFTDRDDSKAAGVVIVNHSFVKRHFPGEEALGKRIHLGTRRPPIWFEIVGVVGDVRQRQLEKDPQSMVYVPHLQMILPSLSVMVRTAGEPSSMVGTVKRAINEVDNDLGVAGLATLDQIVTDSVGERRVLMILVLMLAVLAVIIAAVGIYGVMSYSVAQRTREIGIRLALGGTSSQILRLITGQGLRLALVGVSLGLLGAFATTRLVKGLLFGVSPTDPMTFALIALLLMMVALLACWIPARRAMKVDPMIALRCD